MNEKSLNILICSAFPFIGVCFIVSAMIWRQHFSGRRVLDFTADKLGFALKADAFGLVSMLGFIMIGSGVFFFYQGYETKMAEMQNRYEGRLAEVQKRVEDMQGKVNGMSGVIRDLRKYDLRLNLGFPENDLADPFKTKVNAYICKKGSSSEELYGSIRIDRGVGGLVVYFDSLGTGDKFYIIAEDGNRKWRSDDMEIPKAYLKMNSIEN